MRSPSNDVIATYCTDPNPSGNASQQQSEVKTVVAQECAPHTSVVYNRQSSPRSLKCQATVKSVSGSDSLIRRRSSPPTYEPACTLIATIQLTLLFGKPSSLPPVTSKGCLICINYHVQWLCMCMQLAIGSSFLSLPHRNTTKDPTPIPLRK